MKYRYQTHDENYTPYASGVVFHSLGGHPPLPVRLSSEVFLRAYHLWNPAGDAPCSLYDPLCGSGATLAALKFLHWPLIGSVIGSDVSARALGVAALNLRLLTLHGMEQRIDRLRADAAAFGKDSHREALDAAKLLARRIADPVETYHFLADATDPAQIAPGLAGRAVDIALLDIPYGDVAAWQGAASTPGSDTALERVLASLRSALLPSGVVAVFMPKKHRAALTHYQRVEHIKAGKREVWLLRPQG
jgi:23S rRNA (guanine2535-N1)-methyltransferase